MSTPYEMSEIVFKLVAQPTLRAFPDDHAPFYKVQRLVLLSRSERYTSDPNFLVGVRAGVHHFSVTVAPGQTLQPLEVVNFVHGELSQDDHDDVSAFYRLMGWPTVSYAYHVGLALGWVLSMLVSGSTPVYPLPERGPLKRVRRRRAPHAEVAE